MAPAGACPDSPGTHVLPGCLRKKDVLGPDGHAQGRQVLKRLCPPLCSRRAWLWTRHCLCRALRFGRLSGFPFQERHFVGTHLRGTQLDHVHGEEPRGNHPPFSGRVGRVPQDFARRRTDDDARKALTLAVRTKGKDHLVQHRARMRVGLMDLGRQLRQAVDGGRRLRGGHQRPRAWLHLHSPSRSCTSSDRRSGTISSGAIMF
ncbi:hypothetical protein SAMN00790413_04545 [Deinococcus hopiensis KR-140]|uniref:Uncharacterized protein n=1 Tax=Deinococcus hopiensis KR-140 TaxID=695939 RepID=A0A1W1UJP7_9DEIO|nr:hypothetical protein SAMN00790413_04545 [Deinococcus hopiensis KR-140]